MPRQKIKNRKKILFVINPISGDIDKASLKSEIIKYVSNHDRVVEFYETKGDNDKEELSNFIEKTNPEKVVAVGGDGTCNLVAKVLLNTKIKLGIVPKGSANGLATELKIPGDLHDSLKIILDENSKKIDVLQFDDQHLSLHLSDIGFNATLIERFEEGNLRGFAGYGNHFISKLGGIKTVKFKIEIDGKTKRKKAIMVVIANATRYGTGAVVNPQGKLDDGRFEIIVFRPRKLIQFLKMIIPFFTRQIHRLAYVDIYSGEKVKITNIENQKLQIDGEIMGQPKQISVEIIPQSLAVLVP